MSKTHPTPSADESPAPTSRRRVLSKLEQFARYALGLAALGVAVAFLATPEAAGEPATTDETTVPVRRVAVGSVEQRTLGRELRFSGVVRASRHAEVGFVLSGRLGERLVELGEHVEEGQPLARLDRRRLQSGVERADAAVAQAEADVEHRRREKRRIDHLESAQAVSAATVDEAEHRATVAATMRRQAKARARAAHRDLAEGVVRAPFAGRIAQVNVEPGELVAPGDPVLELVDDHALELEVQVPESMLANLREGDSLVVELPLLDRSLSGTVRTIGAAAPQSLGLFPVVVALPVDAALRAGVTARIIVNAPVASGLVVPVEAILDRSGAHPKVLEIEDLRVRVREVDVLAIVGRDAAVRSLISAGHKVVTRGHTGLADGDEVKVLP